jgi:hypothetical protein
LNAAQYILIFAVRVYQCLFSPVLAALSGPPGRCRFEPNCSQYAIEAIRAHGALKGGALAAWRICRCAPWGGCGVDAVPPVKVKVVPNTCNCMSGYSSSSKSHYFSRGQSSQPSPSRLPSPQGRGRDLVRHGEFRHALSAVNTAIAGEKGFDGTHTAKAIAGGHS